MSDQRKEGKKQVTFWGTPEELDLLKHAYKAAGFSNLAEYLRWIAREQPRPGEMPKEGDKGKK